MSRGLRYARAGTAGRASPRERCEQTGQGDDAGDASRRAGGGVGGGRPRPCGRHPGGRTGGVAAVAHRGRSGGERHGALLRSAPPLADGPLRPRPGARTRPAPRHPTPAPAGRPHFPHRWRTNRRSRPTGTPSASTPLPAVAPAPPPPRRRPRAWRRGRPWAGRTSGHERSGSVGHEPGRLAARPARTCRYGLPGHLALAMPARAGYARCARRARRWERRSRHSRRGSRRAAQRRHCPAPRGAH